MRGVRAGLWPAYGSAVSVLCAGGATAAACSGGRAALCRPPHCRAHRRSLGSLSTAPLLFSSTRCTCVSLPPGEQHSVQRLRPHDKRKKKVTFRREALVSWLVGALSPVSSPRGSNNSFHREVGQHTCVSKVTASRRWPLQNDAQM